MFFRAVFVLVPVGFMVWRNGGTGSIRPVNLGGQAARGLIVLVNSFLFIVALKHLPLADMTAIMFASPLILTALAPIFLRETVGWRRWAAVRSEERRVGKECVSTCRSRWLTYH